MSEEMRQTMFRPRMVESQIVRSQEEKPTTFNPFKYCLQPIGDKGSELVLSRRTVPPSSHSTFRQPSPHILAIKDKYPIRRIDMPIGQQIQQQQFQSTSLAPNKFQHRQYVQTETHYSDLSNQTFKKQMYNLFLDRKQQDTRLWNANFELMWLQLLKEQSSYSNIEQRLLSKLDSFREHPY